MRNMTVTQEGVTESQPGTCVSVTSSEGRHTLNVFRAYRELPNQWGGRGVHKHCDCNGMQFESSDAAFAYAFERGYLRRYYTSPELRAHRVARAERR